MRTASIGRFRLDSPMLPILLLAFALRVFHLDGSAIWWDESLSFYRAMRDIPTILANTIQIQSVLTTDLQPPLYFLILHFLVAAFGASEFALRFFSVVANVGSISLVYVLGRRWFSSTVGLLAAFLAALSPYYVWYSQEARPYALVMFWSLLAMYALTRATSPIAESPSRRGGGRWEWGYVGAAAAALYTNYYAVFLLPFHVIFILLQTRSFKKSVLPILPAVSAIFLLPIIARGAAGNVNSGPSFVDLYIILRDLLHSFSVGITLDAPQTRWIDGTILFLIILGIVSATPNSELPASNSRIPFHGLRFILVLYLLLPTLLIYLASFIRPLYQNSRYLIAWSPAFYLGVALGLGTLARAKRLLAIPGLVIILYGAMLSFNNMYYDPHYAKDDHRAWAESLRERVRAGDFLILDSPHTEELFNYYARDVVPYATLPLLADAGALSYAADRAAVNDALHSNPRVWFLSMHVPFDDPNALIEQFLNQQGVLIDRENFRGASTAISLSLYALSMPTAALADIPNRTQYLFDARLRLLGWDAPKEIKRGTRGVIKLFWQLDEPAGENYGVSLRAVDASGRRVAQWDAVPVGNTSGSSSWTPGKIIVDAHELPIAAESVPGVYRVQVQVYHSATGNGIGDAILLGSITVN